MKHRLARLAGILALALVAAGCGADGEEGSASGVSFDIVAYNNEDVFGGSEADFGDLLGQGTPVVLNFWAAKCAPCVAEMQWLQTASDRHAGEVLMVGIDIGPFTQLGTNEEGSELLDELEITYPAAYAVDAQPLREVEVIGMPFSVFFDADGAIVDTHSGIMTEGTIEDWFSRLADASA